MLRLISAVTSVYSISTRSSVNCATYDHSVACVDVTGLPMRDIVSLLSEKWPNNAHAIWQPQKPAEGRLACKVTVCSNEFAFK